MDPSIASGAGIAPGDLARLEALVRQEQPAFLEDLASLVEVDCGSYTKSGVDRVGRWTARFLERLGARVRVEADARLGDTVVGELAGAVDGPSILLIGHLDTVFPEGTAKERPFQSTAGGPTVPA